MSFNTYLPIEFPLLSQSEKNGGGTQSEKDIIKTNLCVLNRATTYSNAAILREQNRTFQTRRLQTWAWSVISPRHFFIRDSKKFPVYGSSYLQESEYSWCLMFRRNQMLVY
jgi:hypothetical protein